MKNIVCFIDSLTSGGAQKQIVQLAILLSEHKYNVKLVCYWDKAFFLPVIEQHNIEYICIGGASNKYKRLIKVYKYFHAEKPDCVISYLSTPNIIACICKILGCCYNLIVSERNTSQKYDLRTRFRFFLYHKSANSVISNSRAQWNFIKRNKPHLIEKSYIITNYIDTSYFVPDVVKSGDVINTIVVGRITEQKNVLCFIEAIHRACISGVNIRVKWYGRCDSERYYKTCIEAIVNFELGDIFEFLPNTQEILRAYQEADLFILPSLFEGYPNVICEAMSCGLPVLCSDVCDNLDLIKDGINGFLFNPRSIESIVNAIFKYSQLSIEEIEYIRKSNRKYAIETFNKNDFILKYSILFQ